MEYGECRPVGDKDACASSPEGGKDGIAFFTHRLWLLPRESAVGDKDLYC